jgi:hypothetical protein
MCLDSFYAWKCMEVCPQWVENLFASGCSWLNWMFCHLASLSSQCPYRHSPIRDLLVVRCKAYLHFLLQYVPSSPRKRMHETSTVSEMTGLKGSHGFGWAVVGLRFENGKIKCTAADAVDGHENYRKRRIAGLTRFSLRLHFQKQDIWIRWVRFGKEWSCHCVTAGRLAIHSVRKTLKAPNET